MKLSVFENQFTRERFICRDVRQIEMIDGVEYLRVQRWVGGGGKLAEQLRQREFLVRREALKPIRA